MLDVPYCILLMMILCTERMILQHDYDTNTLIHKTTLIQIPRLMLRLK